LSPCGHTHQYVQHNGIARHPPAADSRHEHHPCEDKACLRNGSAHTSADHRRRGKCLERQPHRRVRPRAEASASPAGEPGHPRAQPQHARAGGCDAPRGAIDIARCVSSPHHDCLRVAMQIPAVRFVRFLSFLWKELPALDIL
jgi:hypothetical protein